MDALKLVADNPNLFGILAFMIVFIPVLRYIINWAEKTTAENRAIYSAALQKSEHREEKLQIFIEGKISDHTVSLERINSIASPRSQVGNNKKDGTDINCTA